MADNKSKKTDELGKDELGEVSGGSGIENLIKKPFPLHAYGCPPKPSTLLKYGCPIPRPPKKDEKNEEINNELNPLPDNNEQDPSK